MSLILDALRKSEAERRRGQSPDLFAAPVIPGPLPDRTWLRFWPVPVFAALVLTALFLFRQAPADSLESGDGRRPASDTASDAANVAATPATPPSAPALDTAQRPRDRLASSSPPPLAALGAPGRPPEPVAPAAAVLAMHPAPGNASTAPPANASGPSPGTAPVPSPDARSASRATAPANAAEESLPPISVLDAVDRAALPALKLSMHVFADEPGKRFAIIDGQRVTEGATLGNAVVVAIRRDGVVLDVNGRRVLLPRP